jgi:hypothetical protein
MNLEKLKEDFPCPHCGNYCCEECGGDMIDWPAAYAALEQEKLTPVPVPETEAFQDMMRIISEKIKRLESENATLQRRCDLFQFGKGKA